MSTIRLGQIALSFHRASAAYLTYLLQHRGYEVTIKEAPHEAAFEMLQNNEIDLLATAWLPGSHGKYLEPIKDDILQLGIMYNPYCIWGVPDYSPNDIQTVEDLGNSELNPNISKQIYSINKGAGISRFSLEILDKYDLKKSGYTLENLQENDYFKYIDENITNKNVFVIPFWHPQFLNFKYKFRELAEPNGLLRSQDDATLLIRKDAIKKIDPDTLSFLKNVYLGNAKVSELDYLLHVANLDITSAMIVLT